MLFPHSNNLSFSVEKQSPIIIKKASFPLRYGRYSEIKTSECEFIFNLNGEIKKVQDAFYKMMEVNANYSNIEITGNFLIGEQLLPEHYQSLAELLRTASDNTLKKGAIYLPPLKNSPKKRELLPQFFEIKNQSPLPVYVYLIQRL